MKIPDALAQFNTLNDMISGGQRKTKDQVLNLNEKYKFKLKVKSPRPLEHMQNDNHVNNLTMRSKIEGFQTSASENLVKIGGENKNERGKLNKSTSAAKLKQKGEFVKVLRLKDVNGKPHTNQIRTTVSKVKLRSQSTHPYQVEDKKHDDQKNSSITEYMNRQKEKGLN